MTRFRVSFLPLFLAALALIVAAAVVARIRAYDTANGIGVPGSAAETASGSADRVVPRDANGRPIAEPGSPAAQQTASSDPGVIVEMDGSPSSSTAASREQRFRELLSAPLPTSSSSAPSAAKPPTPAQATPAAPVKPPEQSAFSRMVAPIVNALGGGSRSAAGSVNSQEPQPKKPAVGGTRDDGSKADPNDKTSDSTAPQLLSVEFAPPQVQDGQEAMLILNAMDDLSGIRNVSGSVTSPTGKALQGFSAQREGETSRYVGRIVVPRDAEEGMWRINFLSLADNASNTVNLTYAQSALLQGATLKVTSSRPDSTPPTVKNVWLERQSMSAGEKNTLFAQVVDDKSGVNLVTGVFISPTGLARIGFGCHATQNDTWACDINTPKKIDCGEWKLEQLQLQDKANNMGTDRSAAVTAVHLGIIGEQCDNTPPDIRIVVLEPTVVSNAEQSLVHVKVIVNDDGGVSDISGHAAGPASGGQQPRIFFSLRVTADPQTWTGDIIVPKLASKGAWSVVWIQATDEARNAKTYSRGDPVLANASFTVR